MTECTECKFYYEERDVNFSECKKEMDDKYWLGVEPCPAFEPRYKEEGDDHE